MGSVSRISYDASQILFFLMPIPHAFREGVFERKKFISLEQGGLLVNERDDAKQNLSIVADGINLTQNI